MDVMNCGLDRPPHSLNRPHESTSLRVQGAAKQTDTASIRGEEETHRVELSVDVGGLISSQNQDPGRHVARVLAGHQDGQLSTNTTKVHVSAASWLYFSNVFIYS